MNLLILDVPKHEIYFRSQVLIFFTIFGIIIAWLFSKRKQAEEALQKAHDELENRIARELHEGIGRELSAIKFSVENSLDTLRNYSGDFDLKALEAIIPVAQ